MSAYILNLPLIFCFWWWIIHKIILGSEDAKSSVKIHSQVGLGCKNTHLNMYKICIKYSYTFIHAVAVSKKGRRNIAIILKSQK